MAATQYDYQKLYWGFCIRLKEDPNLKFSYYYQEAGVPWRRLYDWMSRRKISLKRLYTGVGRDLGSEISDYGKTQQQEKTFIPVKVRKNPEVSSPDSLQGCCGIDWDDLYFLMRGLTAVDIKRDKHFGRGK